MRFFRWLPALAVVGSAFSGCGVSASQLSRGEQEALASKKVSVVLFRFAATSAGRPVNAFDGVSFPDLYLAGGFTILAENIDTGDQVKIVRPHGPTAESAEAGWVYLLLERGRYYLHLHPGSPDNLVSGQSMLSGRYILSVPAGGGVIYAGSLAITCSEGPGVLGRIFSGSRKWGPRCSPPETVRDESDSAVAIAQDAFVQYGPPLTILMQGPR